MTEASPTKADAPPKKVKIRTTSGKRVILVMLVLLAMWGGVLSVLVWRTAMAPHYTRLPQASGEADRARP